MSEKPPSPDDLLAQFAEELRQLRHSADDISYRRLAELVGVSPSALSQAVSGRKLPTWNITRAFVKGCGGDENIWHEQWSQVRRELNAYQTNTTNGQLPAPAPVETAPEDNPHDAKDARRRSVRVRIGLLVAIAAVLLSVAGVIVTNVFFTWEETDPTASDSPPVIPAYINGEYKGVAGLYEEPELSPAEIIDPPLYVVGSVAELKIVCQVSDGTQMTADFVNASGVERKEVNDIWYRVLPSNYYVPAIYTTYPYGVEGKLPPGQPFGTSIPMC